LLRRFGPFRTGKIAPFFPRLSVLRYRLHFLKYFQILEINDRFLEKLGSAVTEVSHYQLSAYLAPNWHVDFRTMNNLFYNRHTSSATIF